MSTSHSPAAPSSQSQRDRSPVSPDDGPTGSATALPRSAPQGLVALLAGLAATVAVYQVLPLVTQPEDAVVRYLCSHPLEYVLLAMFFVGVFHGVLRLRLGRRRLAMLDRLEPTLRDPTAEVDQWQTAGVRSGDAVIAARFGSLADLRRRWAGGSIVEYDQLFARRGRDDVAGGYAMLNTILWAIPIVGFLGTVLGITQAIGSITPEQLEGSLVTVTGGLSTAFDTTGLALAFSLLLGFASLVARRQEDRSLVRLDQLSEAWILPHFPDGAKPAGTLDERLPETLAASLTSALEAWADEMATQRQHLGTSLVSLVRESHDTFREELASLRAETLAQQSADFDATGHTLRVAVEQWSSEVAAALGEGSREFAAVVTDASDRATDTLRIAGEQQQRWADVLESTERLEALQSSLDSQLERAGVLEQLDQTVHQLTAAVHLMTSRQRAA